MQHYLINNSNTQLIFKAFTYAIVECMDFFHVEEYLWGFFLIFEKQNLKSKAYWQV